MLATGAVAVTMEDNADQPVLEPGVGETPLWGNPADRPVPGRYRHGRCAGGLPAELLQQANQRVEIPEDKDWEREDVQHYGPWPSAGACGSARAGWSRRTRMRSTCCLTPASPSAPVYPPHHRPVPGRARWHGAGRRVVDYGCGSGILAVAALRLAPARPWGRHDPRALVATRDNAARNGIPAAALQVALPGAYDNAAWSRRSAVVVANIRGPAGGAVRHPAGLLSPGGTLLLSGLLTARRTVCVRTMRAHPAGGGERERRLGLPARALPE